MLRGGEVTVVPGTEMVFPMNVVLAVCTGVVPDFSVDGELVWGM